MASTSESILLHGTWSDYRQHAAVSLDADQETYLKALTVVGLCSNRKTVSYREIQAAVDVATVKELEHLLIHHCIYPGLLSARLDQKNGELWVYKSSPRRVDEGRFNRMIGSLGAWLDEAQKVKYFLDGMGRSLEQATEKVAAAAKAQKIALGVAKKERVGKMEAAEAAEEGGVEKVEDGGVPGKSDMKASVKKPKRKKRMEEVEKDGEDGEEPDEERTTSGEEK